MLPTTYIFCAELTNIFFNYCENLPLSESITSKVLSIQESFYKLSRFMRKPVSRVFKQVWHKPGCTATEDG